MQAVYDQVGASAKDGGPAQGSNFWNLYTAGTGTDDPYQITLADTTTMDVIHTHVRPLECPLSYPLRRSRLAYPMLEVPGRQELSATAGLLMVYS